MLTRLISGLALILLISCGEPMTGAPDARILLMGDSMMAANQTNGHSVAEVMEAELGKEVIDRSVLGARYFFALPISGSTGLRLPAQYRDRDWDWVVLNGGGNDLLFGCGCGKCKRMMDRLVSADGTAGAIPSFVAKIRTSGAQVIYTGYLRNPGTATPIKSCKAVGDELDRRLTLMASHDPGVHFLSLADVVPNGDTTYHALDRIHPSPKGSEAIALKIVPLMVP